jgi:hypothetical protein
VPVAGWKSHLVRKPNPKPDKPDHLVAIDCTRDGNTPPRLTNLDTPVPLPTCLYNGPETVV